MSQVGGRQLNVVQMSQLWARGDTDNMLAYPSPKKEGECAFAKNYNYHECFVVSTELQRRRSRRISSQCPQGWRSKKQKKSTQAFIHAIHRTQP